MAIPISNVTRRVVYAASGTGPYAFTFEILANTDIAVYKDDALLTLTTDYTVTINANGTGSVTLVASPTGATQIAIVGNRTIQRATDFTTGGDFFANTLNDELDQQTIFNQQNAEGLQRALSAPQTDPTSINMTLPRSSVRANKTLAFDTNGNPTTGEVIGDNRGNWATGTAYNKRDIVKDTSNGNVYYANTAHTSTGSQPISTNADAAKWDLIVDNASSSASASAAASSASAAATSASNASSSASAASTSASNAASSASSAASAQTAAEAARDQTLTAFDNFDDRYLGTKSSDPSVDNDGNPLLAGALYFNSTSGIMKVYTGSAWVAAYVSGAEFVAKAGDSMTGALAIDVSTTSAALRVTQAGTGDALLIEDSTNPDSTPFVVDTNGRVIIGNTTTILGAGGLEAALQTVGTGSGTRDIQLSDFNATTTARADLRFNKSLGSSIGTMTAVTEGTFLGRVTFNGSDGTNFINAALISAAVDGTPGTSDMPGRLVFSTTADGASSPTERMRIDSSGDVLIGTTSPRTFDSSTSTVVPVLQTEGTAANTSSASLMRNTASNTGPILFLGKSRSGSLGGATIVQNGDQLGQIIFEGTDGASLVEGASIRAEVDGTPGTNDMPGRLVFSTTADGASSPTEAMRIDSSQRVIVQKASNGAVSALTDGATITPDFNAANNFSVTLGGNRTLANPTNLVAGQSGVIKLTQDGTGSRTLAFGSYWDFAAGAAPTLTTTANAVDILAYYVDSTTNITARLIGDRK